MTTQKTMIKSRTKTLYLILCALFAALISVGTFITIPFYPVPFTMQTVFILFSGLLLGKKYGTVSVLVFMVLGLVGVPVFTGGGGIHYILKPTFGYIVGYVIGAFVIGLIAHGKKNPSVIRLIVADLVGMGIIYLIGMVYLFMSMNLWIEGDGISITAVIMTGFVPTILKDLLLCVVCGLLSKKLIPILAKEIGEV